MILDKMSLGGIHRKTSHIRDRIRPHAMDFGNYPLPFKVYEQGRGLPLKPVQADPGGHLCRKELLPFLSSFLFLSYGVTQVRQAGAIPFFSRTVPSAGGLYPCHLYVGVLPRRAEHQGTAARDNTETSLFYYDPAGHRLVLLRGPGGDLPDLSSAGRSDTALVFMVTACLYNSAWKYRDRALRYVMLDAGHLAENLVLACGDMAVTYDFDDREIGALLDLDLSREVPLVLGSLGWDKSVSESVRQLEAETRPCFPDVRIRPAEAAYMEKFPFIGKIHALGSVYSAPAVVPGDVWQKAGEGHLDLSEIRGKDRETSGGAFPVGRGSRPGGDDLARLMIERRSSRNFVPRPVSREAQLSLLSWVCKGLTCWHPWITLGFACRGWEGMTDGIYALDPEKGRLNFMAAGNFHPLLARACLGQEWVGQAAAVFLCLADLEALDEAGGIRAYRYAMLAAGRAGQRLYLGAEATGQGCCGIGAIYDDEAASLLGLADRAALLYALALGPVKKKLR